MPTIPYSKWPQETSMNFGRFPYLCWKQKFRWLFHIQDVCDEGVNALVAQKATRPTLTFKEAEIQHMSEVVYTPIKAEWKAINLTLYDTIRNKHPVFEWIKRMYNPGVNPWAPTGVADWTTKAESAFTPISCNDCEIGYTSSNNGPIATRGQCFKIAYSTLRLLDGCGNTVEEWAFENMWPQEIDFGDLDYSSSEIVTVQLNLRFDRAYLIDTRF